MKKAILLKINHLRMKADMKSAQYLPNGMMDKNDDLALGMLKAYATKFEEIRKNYDIKLYSFYPRGTRYEWRDLLKLIDLEAPEIVCFSCFVWNIETILKTVEAIKTLHPKTLIILGGPDISRERFEKSQADIGVKGEGEITFTEILKTHLNNQDYTKIQGIYHKKNNKTTETPDRPPIQNLDDIPSPYLTNTIKPYKAVALESYRGCPFKCAYCFSGRGFQKIRQFSLDRIKKEIEFCGKNGLRAGFVDTSVNFNKDYFLEVLAEIKRCQEEYGQPKPIIPFEISPFFSVDEVFTSVKDVCPTMIFEVGVQSINPETLKAIERPCAKDRVQHVVEAAEKNGLRVQLDLMAGLPGESFFSHASAIQFCLKNRYKFQSAQTKILERTVLKSKANTFGIKYVDFPPNLTLANDKSSFKELNKTMTYANVIENELGLGFEGVEPRPDIRKARIKVDGLSLDEIKNRLLGLKDNQCHRVVFSLEDLKDLNLISSAIELACQLRFVLIGLEDGGPFLAGAQRHVSFDQVTFFNRTLFETALKCNFFRLVVKRDADLEEIHKVLNGLKSLNAGFGSLNGLERGFVELKVELSEDNCDQVAGNIEIFLGENIQRVLLKVVGPIRHFEKIKSAIETISNKLYLADTWLSILDLPICVLPGQEEHIENLFSKERYELVTKCLACSFKDHCAGIDARDLDFISEMIGPLSSSDKLEEIIKLRKEVTA